MCRGSQQGQLCAISLDQLEDAPDERLCGHVDVGVGRLAAQEVVEAEAQRAHVLDDLAGGFESVGNTVKCFYDLKIFCKSRQLLIEPRFLVAGYVHCHSYDIAHSLNCIAENGNFSSNGAVGTCRATAPRCASVLRGKL